MATSRSVVPIVLRRYSTRLITDGVVPRDLQSYEASTLRDLALLCDEVYFDTNQLSVLE